MVIIHRRLPGLDVPLRSRSLDGPPNLLAPSGQGRQCIYSGLRLCACNRVFANSRYLWSALPPLKLPREAVHRGSPFKLKGTEWTQAEFLDQDSPASIALVFLPNHLQCRFGTGGFEPDAEASSAAGTGYRAIYSPSSGGDPCGSTFVPSPCVLRPPGRFHLPAARLHLCVTAPDRPLLDRSQQARASPAPKEQ